MDFTNMFRILWSISMKMDVLNFYFMNNDA